MSNRLFGDDPEQFGKELFKAHEETSRGIFGIFKVFACLWLVWVAVVICALAGLGYVAYHFLSKVW
jgi:hypothetical protein